MTPQMTVNMRAHVRTHLQEAPALPTSAESRTQRDGNDGDSDTRYRNVTGPNQETALDRATREVSEMQAQWCNTRDLGNLYRAPSQPHDEETIASNAADSPILSTLLIAQHEWRKVLDGTKGADSRQSTLPLTDAIHNKPWATSARKSQPMPSVCTYKM